MLPPLSSSETGAIDDLFFLKQRFFVGQATIIAVSANGAFFATRKFQVYPVVRSFFENQQGEKHILKQMEASREASRETGCLSLSAALAPRAVARTGRTWQSDEKHCELLVVVTGTDPPE